MIPDISSLISDALESAAEDVVSTTTTTETNDDSDSVSYVTVTSAGTDTTGNKITLTCDKTISNPAGKQGQFTVLVDGSPNSVTAAALNTIASKIDLTLEWPISYGETITVGFNDYAGTIYAIDGSELKTFSGYSVTNNVGSTGEVYTKGSPYHVIGETVGILVVDPDMDTTDSFDEVAVNVRVYGSSSSEITVALTETEADTGEFVGSFTLTGIDTGDPDSITTAVGDVVKVTYIDAEDSSGQVNHPRFTDITVTDLARNVLVQANFPDGILDGTLNWEAAADESVITHYAVYFLNNFNNIVGSEITTVPVVPDQVNYTEWVSVAVPAGATQIGVFSMNANDHKYLSAVSSNFSLFGSFEPTVGGLVYGRYLNTATSLSDGRVLFTGGIANETGAATASAEVFDPDTQIFTQVGDMSTSRFYHSAVLLQNGEVLITGGVTANDEAIYPGEVFDPSSGNFTTVGSMVYARVKHTATTLNDGTVLITGGMDYTEQALASAELYGGDGFVSVNSMVYARIGHTATLLSDGRVLIIGGSIGSDDTSVKVGQAEIYDPITGTFSASGNLGIPRNGHTATLLQDGKVLITGGFDNDGMPVASAELWDPATETFSSVSDMMLPRVMHNATLLPNGWVLITGGTLPYFTEIYDPSLESFIIGPFSKDARIFGSAVLLYDNTVLIAGGLSADTGAFPQQGEIYKLIINIPA